MNETVPLEPLSEEESRRFWARVSLPHPGTGCMVWTGQRHGSGYGVYPYRGRYPRAHRVAYADAYGSLPDELTVDHLCRNRLCVRPDHLEAVTNRINVLRGVGATAKNFRKTHCNRGHEFTTANTYVRPSRPNERTCLACKRQWG